MFKYSALTIMVKERTFNSEFDLAPSECLRRPNTCYLNNTECCRIRVKSRAELYCNPC